MLLILLMQIAVNGFWRVPETPAIYDSRKTARKPSCWKWRSLVRASERASRGMVCIEMQSVRLYSLSGHAR